MEAIVSGGMDPTTLYDLLQGKEKLITIEKGALSSVERASEQALIKGLGDAKVEPNLLNRDAGKLMASANEFRNKPVDEINREIAKYKEYQNQINKYPTSTPSSKGLKADMMRLAADQVARLEAIVRQQSQRSTTFQESVEKKSQGLEARKDSSQAKNIFRPSKWRL
jgi:hypothetical protein